jgi:hypothetical protein
MIGSPVGGVDIEEVRFFHLLRNLPIKIILNLFILLQGSRKTTRKNIQSMEISLLE